MRQYLLRTVFYADRTRFVREELLQQTAKACLAAGAESVDTLALDLSIDKVISIDKAIVFIHTYCEYTYIYIHICML